MNQDLIDDINERYPLYKITPEMCECDDKGKLLKHLPYPQSHLYTGMSYSAIKLFASCPKMYEHRYIKGNWPAKTDGQVEGNAVHCLVLEPEKFESKYVEIPRCDRRTKEGKSLWAKFEQEANGRQMLGEKDMRKVKAAAAELVTHPIMRDALSKKNRQVEQQLFWTDTDTGVRCQLRSDLSVGGIMADIKTGPADERGFLSTVEKMYYDIQNAMYWDGKIANGHRQEYFIFFAIELEEPHLCAAYTLSPDTMASARYAYKYWLSLFDACCKTGVWPGLEKGIKQLSLSTWKQNERTRVRKDGQNDK